MPNPLTNLFSRPKTIAQLMENEEALSSTEYTEWDALRLLNHYWKAGELDRYREFLHKLLSNNCYSEKILQKGMETYFSLNDYKNAYHLAKKLCYEFDKPVQALYKLGYLAYVNGEYRFAINWLNEYHERLKPTAASENFLASCHLRLGEFRNALDIFQRIAPRDEVTQWLQRVCSQGRTRQNKNWHGRKTTPMKRLQSLRWRNDILRGPLKHQARTLSEIDTLINSFQYVSDERLFNAVDYWQMPSQFEANRRGDCEDFALWVWIQLLRMNIRARFFLGGWYHEEINHAWVCIYDKQGVHLLECTPQDVNRPIPVRSAYDYVPVLSIDKSLIWYQH